MRAQMIRRTDTGQHEKLRRFHGAAGHDDFAVGGYGLPRAAHRHRRPARPAHLDNQMQRLRVRHNGQVLSAGHRREIGPRRTHTPTVRHVDVVIAEAVDRIPVEILQHRKARRPSRCQKRVADRQLRPRRPHLHRPRSSMPGPLAPLVALRAFEIGQHVVRRPVHAAHLPPKVVLARMTTRVDHPVDAARPADHPALQEDQVAAVHARHRFRGETPIEFRMRADGEAQPRQPRQHRIVPRPGLQQHDRHVRVLRQPCRHDGTGGAGPDHQIIAGTRQVAHFTP